MQIANFIVSGLLAVAIAFGMRRVLHPGPAGTVGPLLVGVYDLGIITARIFVADHALGYPAGVPSGEPDVPLPKGGL